MKVKKNTDAPQTRIVWKQVFLVALHVAVLVLSLMTHELTTTEVAPRALPQTLHAAFTGIACDLFQTA